MYHSLPKWSPRERRGGEDGEEAKSCENASKFHRSGKLWVGAGASIGAGCGVKK